MNKTIAKKKKIINNYNKTASFYDNRYKKIQEQKYKIILNNYRSKPKLILDAGCGTGLFLEFIITHTIEKELIPFIYVGTDLSLNMLKIFRIKLQRLKLKYEFDLILSDIENLPFRENIFQTIFSLTSFQNLPNIDEAIKSLYRVGRNKADLYLSILRKKCNLKEVLGLLGPLGTNLKITNEQNLEDIIIQGKILKH